MKAVVFIFCFFSLFSFGQIKKSSSNLFVLKAGYSYQKSNFGEIGIASWKQKDGGTFKDNSVQHPWFIHGPSLGSEFKLDFKNFIAAPKIGHEFYYTPFCIGTRINLVDYTDFKKSDLRIVPELGLSIIGVVNVFYGYSLALNNNEFSDIGRHKLSVFFNMPLILLKRYGK